jgi:ligand-binding SRPBCC domain-containing protein
MRIHTLHREQRLPGTPEEVFPFFADAFNLEAITPPLLRFRIVTPPPIEMGVGTFIQYALRIRGVPVRWDTLIQAWEPPYRFVDTQVRGPYRLWHHTHTFVQDGDETVMTDVVKWSAPLDRLTAPIVQRDVEAIFDFRFQALRGRRFQAVEHEVHAR